MSQEQLLKGLGEAVKALNTKIDSLVEEVKQLKEENKQLREENAQLKAELAQLRQQLNTPSVTKKGGKSIKVLPGFESQKESIEKHERNNQVKELRKQAKEECTKTLAPINKQLMELGVDELNFYIGQSQRSYNKVNEENKQLKMKLDEVTKELESKDAEIARLKKLLGEIDTSNENHKERLERLGVR